MAIGSKPKRNQTDITKISPDDAALKFIAGAGEPVQAPPEPAIPEPELPTAIIVRGFDAELMRRLNAEAARRRVSRAAMVRMLLAEHLPE
jgi:hypothetical protein